MEDIFKSLEDDGFEFKVEVGWKDKSRKKEILEAIKKLKKSGDESKLLYAKNLYRYYSIFDNLHCLLKSHAILIEKEDKYHCEDFYNYIEDNVIDSSKMIITGIISAVANDEPLDSFYKYLMYPDLYREEYEKDNYIEEELI